MTLPKLHTSVEDTLKAKIPEQNIKFPKGFGKIDAQPDNTIKNAKVNIGGTTSKYNVGKLGGDNEVLQQAIKDVAPKFEKAVGNSISFDEVIKYADDTNKILVDELGREQVLELGAAQLRLRENIAKLANQNQVTPELINSIKRDAEFARGIAQLLGQRNIDVSTLKPSEKLKVDLIQNILKTSDDVVAITAEASKVDFNNASSVATFYRKFKPATFTDILDEFRYNNMLSNPKTYLRNAYSNAFQTFVTRPGTLFFSGKPKEAVKYTSGTLKSLPDAVGSFIKTYKEGSIAGKPDLSTVSTGKLPKFMTIPTRALEATDVFFRTLISGGEGSIGTGAKQAEDIAEYSLFRQDLHPQGQGWLLNKIDDVTDWTYKAPKAVRWFVPFIRTPMNVAKQWIEYSPAGIATIPGTANRREQIGKVLFGSTVFAMGAVLAADDRTTWDAPTDSKEKELFYASGKKPFSVKVGDKWIPMMYFGPFALALGMPAAMKYYQEDDRNALTDSQVDKAVSAVTSLTKLLSGQTFMQGLDNFVKFFSGDADYSIPGNLAFTAGQIMPMQGLLRYISTVVDPIYRKPGGSGNVDRFINSFKKDIPFMSKSLPAYTDPMGNPSTRLPVNNALPYDIGQDNSMYSEALKNRKSRLQINAVKNDIKKKLESGGKDKSGKIQTSPSGVKYAFIDGELLYTDSEGVHSLNLEMPDRPVFSGNTLLDKRMASSYKTKLSSRAKNVTTLYELGILNAQQTEQLLRAIDVEYKKISATTSGGKLSAPSLGSVPSLKLPMLKASTARIPKRVLQPPKLSNAKYQMPKPANIDLDSLRNPL
jgi:hypothetical protein